jgi:hypothetical protein
VNGILSSDATIGFLYDLGLFKNPCLRAGSTVNSIVII